MKVARRPPAQGAPRPRSFHGPVLRIPAHVGPHIKNPPLHALPVSMNLASTVQVDVGPVFHKFIHGRAVRLLADREVGTTAGKSTRLNSSHSSISYAVFC